MANQRIVQWFLFAVFALVIAAIAVSALSSVFPSNPLNNQYLSGVVAFNVTTQNDTENVTWRFYYLDANLGTAIRFNHTINGTAACVNVTNATCSFSLNTATITDGVYNITINATNSSNATAVTNITTNITIDNTVPRISLGTNAVNGTNFTVATVGFNWTVIDGFDTQPNCSININGTFFNVSTNTLNNSQTNITVINIAGNGTHGWNITCSDSGGNVNTSATRSFRIDQQGPLVTANTTRYPAGKNASNASDSIELNVTVYDAGTVSGGPGRVTANGTGVCSTGNVSLIGTGMVDDDLPGISRVFTGTCILNSTSTVGNNTINVIAEDDLGNRNTTTNFIVRVDRESPGNVTLRMTPGFNFTQRIVTLNWSARDDLDSNLSCDVMVNGTITNSSVGTPNSSNTFVNYTTTSDGTYFWNVTCYDDARQQNISNTTGSFTVATLGPIVSFREPSAVNKSFTGTFNLVVLAEDALAVSRVILQILNGSNFTTIQYYGMNTTNMSNSGGGLWNISLNATNLTTGYYTALVNATDNNSVTNTTNRTFVIDLVVPVITAFSLSDTTVTEGDSITSSCTATDNFQEVGTSVTGISTVSAGTKTATCMATDRAGNTATSTVDYTVSAAAASSSSSSSSDSGSGGGSGGSGAGSSTAPVTGSSTGVSEVSAGEEVTLDIPKYDGLAFGAITFTPSEDLSDVEISAHRYDVAPVGTDAIEGLAYQYVKIDETNVKGITSAVITFKVSKEWLDTNKVAKEHISLYRWTGSAWVEFKASVTSEDTTHVFYKATVSGLSVFAIGRSSTAPAAPAETPAPTPTPTPTPASVVAKQSNTGWIIAIVVLALIVGVGYYWYRKNR